MSAKVRGAALALLGRRDYTTAELRERLIDREHPPAEVDAVIAALVEDRTINDRRVAASHVRVSSQIKGRGRLRIRQELAARGIDRHLADELIAELPPENEAASIAKFLSRKRFPAKPTAAERQKIFQQLLRKGFTSEAISRALRASGK
jgi:regulatory protein